jgi:hypothetical protein
MRISNRAGATPIVGSRSEDPTDPTMSLRVPDPDEPGPRTVWTEELRERTISAASERRR